DFRWEPSKAAVYSEFWKRHGFQRAGYYSSRAYRNGHELLELTRNGHERARNLGYTTRPFQMRTRPAEELALIEGITRQAFRSSFLIEPIQTGIYNELYVKPFLALAGKYCLFIVDPDGKEVGYGFTFEDKGHLIWKTLAVIPSEHGKGLSNFFMHASAEQGLDDGIKYVVAALVKEEGASDFTVKKFAPILAWIHEYEVFSLALKDTAFP
ncbi:MAG: hypothetical protein WCK82_15700, partial [Bacteroidota bacterium]